jgi:hypothetical protein
MTGLRHQRRLKQKGKENAKQIIVVGNAIEKPASDMMQLRSDSEFTLPLLISVFEELMPQILFFIT